LLSVNDNGKVRQYEYDRRGYPTRTKYADGTTEIRVPTIPATCMRRSTVVTASMARAVN